GLDADEIAYLCYTSGSTGKPKGIRVPHRGVPLLARDRRLLPIEPEDRMAQCCNFAFDVSQYELWSTLLNGACLVAVPRPLLS
ncbi:AMP-binding protein, partial [Staphylococcus aureus]